MDESTIGIMENGKRVKVFWDEMDEDTAAKLSLNYACRDLGTEKCLSCELGEAKPLDDCDFDCRHCEYETTCPCSLYSWRARQRYNV